MPDQLDVRWSPLDNQSWHYSTVRRCTSARPGRRLCDLAGGAGSVWAIDQGSRDTCLMGGTSGLGRRPFDFEAYARRVHDGPCFICATVGGDPDYEHELLYQDDDSIAFLAREPTLLGYSLVAPKRHAERLETDLGLEEYLRLQEVVYKVANAVATSLPTERVYVLSLGSQQGNSHVHWHIAPLPPGVPSENQQFHAVMAEHGVLEITREDMRALGATIRRALDAP